MNSTTGNGNTHPPYFNAKKAVCFFFVYLNAVVFRKEACVTFLPVLYRRDSTCDSDYMCTSCKFNASPVMTATLSRQVRHLYSDALKGKQAFHPTCATTFSGLEGRPRAGTAFHPASSPCCNSISMHICRGMQSKKHECVACGLFHIVTSGAYTYIYASIREQDGAFCSG